jgi:hypothetical protein
MTGLIDPAEGAFEIVPSDDTNLMYVTRGLYVGILGDVHVITAAGDNVTFVELAAGVVHPLRIRRVLASGTDAGELIGVY